MRIADNPKIWGRIPSPEDRPEHRPKHGHEYDDMGWCKACGISSFRAHWDNEEQCPGTRQELGLSAMGNAQGPAIAAYDTIEERDQAIGQDRLGRLVSGYELGPWYSEDKG
jgi:hypothetical protein